MQSSRYFDCGAYGQAIGILDGGLVVLVELVPLVGRTHGLSGDA